MMLLLAVMISDAAAQYSQSLYFMNLPQRSALNPALRQTSRLYIGLPALSGLTVNLDNNFINMSDLFIDGVISDSTVSFLEPGEHLDRLIDGLKDKNSIELQAAVQLFGLGFSVGKDLWVSLDLTERAEGNFVLPGDLIRLGIRGNEGYTGQTIDLSSLRTDAKYYHEIGVGISKNITDRMRLGVRGKILFGVAAATLDNNDLRLRVNEDNTHTLFADMSFSMSGPVYAVMNPDGTLDSVSIDDSRFESTKQTISLLTNTGNPGFGLDFGIEYRITDRLSVSGAITDLGFIRWRTDRTTLFTKTQFEFNGLTMQDVYDESLDFGELINWTLDSLQNTFYKKADSNPFVTYLSPGVTAAASYSPVKAFTFGVLSHTRFIGRQVRESVTLSANMNLLNALSATCSYTAVNHRYDNLGAGIALRGGWMQLYAMVDNIPIRWTKVSSGNDSFAVPEDWNTIHARVGMNILFGNKAKNKSSDLD